MPFLDPTEATTREKLLLDLDNDSLFDYWYARLGALEWIQSLPNNLEIPLKRTGHTSHLDRMEDLLSEMISTTSFINSCFESYKNIVQKYQILDDDFAKRETANSELFQHLLQDVFERLEDLYMLACAFVGPIADDSLPLEIYKNIGYTRSWMGIAWKVVLQNHVMLKLSFVVDGSYGKLREIKTEESCIVIRESIALEPTLSNESDSSVDSLDFLTPSEDELDSFQGSPSFLRRSRSVLSRLTRMGMRKKA